MTRRCGDRRHEDVLAIDLRARGGERAGCRDDGADRVHRGYGNVRSLTCVPSFVRRRCSCDVGEFYDVIIVCAY